MSARPRRLVVALVACASSLAPVSPISAAEVRVGQPVMGTVLQVTVDAVDAATARRLADDCLREARRWDDVLTTWRPEGELARLNDRAGRGAVGVSADLATALERMVSLSAATGGAFDPAIGLWVDRGRTRTPGPEPRRPMPIGEAVRISGRQVTLARGVAIDAGGIGKGIAIDGMVELLRRGGADAAFIDFGGSSVHALGAPGDDPKGWTVAVSGLESGELLGVLSLRDESLSTSRSSGPGDPAGPIVNPWTGAPIESRSLVTVLATDAAAAEAWSKAVIVLGTQGLENAEKAGVDALLQRGDRLSMTPSMAKKISLPSQK